MISRLIQTPFRGNITYSRQLTKWRMHIAQSLALVTHRESSTITTKGTLQQSSVSGGVKFTSQNTVPKYLFIGQNRFASGKSSSMEVAVPTMGDSITEGTINEWKFPLGSYVQEGQLIAVIDTDKVSVDINAAASGKLEQIFANNGETVQVGAPLYTINTDFTKPPETASPTPPAEKVKTASTEKVAVVEKIVQKPPSSPPVNKITETQTPQKKVADTVSTGSDNRTERRIPMSRMRLRIAERLKGAQNTAAMLTTFNECDMGNIMALRSEVNDAFVEKFGVKMGYVSAFMMASALSLKKFPEVNAHITEDNQIVYKDYVDISVAVATPNGLMVPVVRDCDKKTWSELEMDLAKLAAKARKSQIALEDMAGGSFTISNGGVYGSMMGTPIINPPQSAILGMHGVTKRPVVRNDSIVIRPIMYLALTYDHRLIDGREAVLFLCSVRDYIQDPRKMLLGL